MFLLDDVGYSVGTTALVNGIDLAVERGSVTALIGHNGSGKSTLLRLLAGQDRPTTGTIAFQGRPLALWPRRAFARQAAYLPQEPAPAGDLTVTELVRFGRFPWRGTLGRFATEDKRIVSEAVERCGLQELRARGVRSLSGGERQRAWIAMLMAQDAAAMLLDEPISALDLGHQLEVLGLLRSATLESGLTTVIVMHDVNLAARFCDRIVALRGGHLLASGAPRDVMRADRLRAIYDVEMGVTTHPTTGTPLSYAL